MIVHVQNPKERRAHFPPDLFALLLLPAFAVLSLVIGPQRFWIVLLLIGCFALVAGLLLFRSSRVRLFAWVYLLFGIAAFGAGIYYAFIAW